MRDFVFECVRLLLFFGFVFLLGLYVTANAPAHAEYEGIKSWEEDLICFHVSILGKRGEPIRLKWKNFLTFDENNKMVFLRMNSGIHIVPTKNYVCMPEDSVDDLWPEGE